jgi:glycosyltransferase involved in cell wall biosynthesis
MEKIGIIIPAYNEEKRIGNTLEKYGKFFENLRDKKVIDYSIIVVINNTRDKTEEIVKIYARHNKRITFLNLKPGGKGFAVKEGFKEAIKDEYNNLIGFVDADCSTPPEAFYDLIKNIGKHGGIIASRYLKGAKVDPKPSLQRMIVSRMFNILFRILFQMNYKDTQCGAKVFQREIVKKVVNKMDITQWAFDIELLYKIKKEGYEVVEHPTVWADKEYSKINFMRSGPLMVLAIIRLRLIHSKLNFLVRFYNRLPNWLKIHKLI